MTGRAGANDWSFRMTKQRPAGKHEKKPRTLSLVSSAPTSSGLDAGVEAHIGGLLKSMYDSVLQEPVPDRFLDLLQQIEEADAQQRGKKRDGGTAKKPRDDR
jgi:hypothetical protein